MELKLEKFINNVELLTNIHSQNKNPILFRLPVEGSSLGLVFFCGYSVPRYVVLPENGVWIDFNPESETFRSAFKRTSHDSANPYNDVWTELYFYDDAMEEQHYSPNDIGVVAGQLAPVATVLTHGVGYLSYPQSEARVIQDGDSTLTDARPPLEHTHPETPASMFSVNKSNGAEHIPVQDQAAPKLGQILVFENDTVTWRKLKEGELK
ncbi:hypothetical protein HOU08_gp149 [Dickeya phage vB_DsoM_JA29]|uniref:Uncharacterized protein n=1 Tax=Dickeya phage vB_DsoM_JA29 TaxID=2283031 RepID=A0A384ZXD4_9CAUD|nr:hypothetical protein HOU08_gp149 [Dickeya phage vB_DsoM_JA29]AXG66875.1 hypothetical protein JA29_149 [Dickeya phage vB_DsoM_JA29]